MKPRIRLVRGIWTCRVETRGGGIVTVVFPIGHGYTVRQAYEDWRIQMEAQRA